MSNHDSESVFALARAAMATRFEIVLPGPGTVRLRAAGEAALDEIERLEAQLSFYRPDSELMQLNQRAAYEPVLVEPQLFALLQRAHEIYTNTMGAFDPTIAPLMRSWGFVGAGGGLPDPGQLEAARAVTGMNLVELNPAARTVRFHRPGVMIDLGAIGKGYAIDRAVEVLRDLEIENAIIHGGTSTAYGLGMAASGERWKVAIPRPHEDHSDRLEPSSSQEPPLAVVALHNEAVSVSAYWGKAFKADGKWFGHVLDPRLGRPVMGAVMAAMVTRDATDADAGSTALLALGSKGIDLLLRADPASRLLVVEPKSDGDNWKVSAHGISLV